MIITQPPCPPLFSILLFHGVHFPFPFLVSQLGLGTTRRVGGESPNKRVIDVMSKFWLNGLISPPRITLCPGPECGFLGINTNIVRR